MIISVTMWLWVMLLIYAIQLRFLCLWIFKLACVSFIIGFGSVHTKFYSNGQAKYKVNHFSFES
jgi:hypothetical protein